ncbi:MAG: polysaccharide deacetylase family protein [Acidobacteriota bacterium]|nr:polysaccharide deacetylase family protein [Acidobacteriota bacterium]
MKTRPALLLLLTLPALLIAQPAREQALRQASPSSASSSAHTFAHTVPTLAARLGFKAGDRVLIVNGDDVGMSHAANAATIDAMENGLMTSATIMVPCSWFPEIAAYAIAHPNSDFGLHLTHTSEWKNYRWGPVASKSDVPGLVDPQGYLWPDIMSVYKNSTPEQAEREARAQIKKALAAGIDVTHFDSHMGALQFDDRYFQVYRKLAKEFDVPLRMGSQEILARAGGAHQRAQLDADGILYPDNLVYGGRKSGESVKDYWKRMLSTLKPGVTELYIHAALAGGEMRSITNSWQERATEHELFTKDPEIRELLNSQNVKRIGFRALRDLQRKSRQSNAGQTRL